ncbi:hypothetical protein GBA52_011464 [Prunus armeniaca]|nr:hypothetical protein GBA52_011464 [Prunus armeniaca]
MMYGQNSNALYLNLFAFGWVPSPPLGYGYGRGGDPTEYKKIRLGNKIPGRLREEEMEIADPDHSLDELDGWIPLI